MFVLVHGAGMRCQLLGPAGATPGPARHRRRPAGARQHVPTSTSRRCASTTAPRDPGTSCDARRRRLVLVGPLLRRRLGAPRDGGARAAAAPRRLPLGGGASGRHRGAGPDRSGGSRELVRAAIVGGIYSQDREAAPRRCCATTSDTEQTDWTLDRVIDDSAALLTEIVDLSGLVGRRAAHLRPDDPGPLLPARPPGTVGRARGRGRAVPRHRSHGDGVRAAAGRRGSSTPSSDECRRRGAGPLVTRHDRSGHRRRPAASARAVGPSCCTSEGARVHVADLDRDAAGPSRRSWATEPTSHVLDVTDEAAWAAALDAMRQTGPLTTLVNSAGSALKRPAARNLARDFRRSSTST